MASTRRDPVAALLEQLALRVPVTELTHPKQVRAHHQGAIWGLLTADPQVTPADALPDRPALRHYPDSGVVHYEDGASDITLALQCGPTCGATGYARATGPCDRADMLCGFGHFVLTSGRTPLLVSPDGGYRLRGSTRSLLLVDGQGPVGDVGYPMSIPSFRHRGEAVDFVRWDAAKKRGHVRLDLAPAYPDEAGVLRYTRDFLLIGGEHIVCRDTVSLQDGRDLTWHFQGRRSDDLRTVAEDAGRIGHDPFLQITARSGTHPVRCTVHPTEVAYSYASVFDAFDHLRFSLPGKTTRISVDFMLSTSG